MNSRLRESHIADGQGPCVSWVVGIKDAGVGETDGTYRWIRVEEVQWPIKTSSPVWTDHRGFRVTISTSGDDGEPRHFFIDNGWLGGGDHVFFDSDVPDHYAPPFVPGGH